MTDQCWAAGGSGVAPHMITLDWLNTASAADFAAALDGIFENAPWVPEQAASARPFPTVTALHEALFATVEALPQAERRRFLLGHPELAAAAPMADFSVAEQDALGLAGLDPARRARLAADNAAYRARFAIPFIICARRHTRASVLRELARRLDGAPDAELAAALSEVHAITRLRLVALVDGPGLPPTAGRVTTHVLDTAAGRPAAGIPVALFEIDDGTPLPLAQSVTDADGRTGAPLLSGAPLRIGTYELRFDVAAHFAGSGAGFLGVIPVRFSVTEPEAHYHVPLLVSPGAYSTYRGS